MMIKNISHFFLLLMFFVMVACSSDKLVLTGTRQDIDIATLFDFKTGDSKLVGGGYGLTKVVQNNEWRSTSGAGDRQPPHGAWTGRGVLRHNIKIGAGSGYDTLYPPKVRDFSRVPTERATRNILNIAPIVADNKIFTVDSRYQIRAFDWVKGEDTPSLRWVNTLNEGRSYNFAYGGGLSFGRGGTNGRMPILVVATGFGKVYGLSADNGDIIFTQDVLGPVRSAPAIVGSVAIVKTIDGTVLGISTNDGRILWRKPVILTSGNDLSNAIGYDWGSSAPTAGAGRVWVGTVSGSVLALNASNGNILWQDGTMRFKIGDVSRYNDIVGNMPLSNGVVYAFSFGNSAIAFRASDGLKLWRKNLSTNHHPIINNQTIFIIDADYNLKAINRATGNVFWSQILKKYLVPQSRDLTLLNWRGPLLVAGRIFVVNDHGDYQFFDARNGEILTQGNASVYQTDADPIVAKGRILLVNRTGNLLIIE